MTEETVVTETVAPMVNADVMQHMYFNLHAEAARWGQTFGGSEKQISQMNKMTDDEVFDLVGDFCVMAASSKMEHSRLQNCIIHRPEINDIATWEKDGGKYTNMSVEAKRARSYVYTSYVNYSCTKADKMLREVPTDPYELVHYDFFSQDIDNDIIMSKDMTREEYIIIQWRLGEFSQTAACTALGCSTPTLYRKYESFCEKYKS